MRITQFFLNFCLLIFGCPSLAFAIDVVKESQKKEWRDRLFYSGNKSLVINNSFFISKEGMSDPTKELEAVMDLLKSGDRKRIGQFACKFPSRYLYVLNLLNQKPEFFCDDFISWRDSFEAEGLSLMFASQYLENPASSFGHTYLKVNSSKKALYLNKVISFAANVPKDVDILEYLWKGLMGGFPGYFSVHPFYFLYHEYANMEQRDVWEFELDISKEKTLELLALLYELIFSADFDYLFLTDNCSALLLSLLDMEFKEDLLEKIPFYVVPIETAKILEKKGFVRRSIFHPSITSRMKAISREMNDKEIKESTEYIHRDQKLSVASSSKTLDLSLEYLNFKRQKQAGELLSQEQKDFDHYLHLRSQKPAGEIPKISPLNPLGANNPVRITLGAQSMDYDSPGLSFSIRPVGRDFLDRPNGFVKESEVNLLRLKFFYDPSEANKSWGEIDVIGIRKFGDYDPITKSASWGVNLALRSRVEEGHPSMYYSEFDSFYGFGKSLFNELVLSYLVFHPTVQVGNLEQDINFLPQAELGFIYTTESLSFKTSFFLGSRYNLKKWESLERVRSSLAYSFSDSWSLSLSQSYFKLQKSFNSSEVGIVYYFF